MTADESLFKIPSPSECFGIVGLAIGLVIFFIGVGTLLFAFESLMPWNFIATVVGGLIWFLSAVYCLVWKEV